MARVIVSAGHTNEEPGAIIDDLREVDLARTIANKVTSKLRQTGIVTLSVPPELDLNKRIEWINNTGYQEETEDICIEIHINDGGMSGLEGWYQDRGENKSQTLTTALLEEASKTTSLTNQGPKSELDHPLGTLAFVHNTKPTSSLIECLYIDNPQDQEFLRDDSKLDSLAQGIVNAIMKFFNIDTQDVSLDKDQSPPSQVQSTNQFSIPQVSPSVPSHGSGYTPPPPMHSQPYTSPSMFPTPTPYSGFGGGMYGPQTQQQPQTREEKKQMIQNLYHKILGRKVSDQDLNYFLNLGLTEDQMIKRLIESQEHADIVHESQEFKKIQPEYSQLKTENQELKGKVKDQEKLIEQQNILIEQKNKSIQQIHQSEDTNEPDLFETEPTYPSVSPKETVSPEKQEIQNESLVDKMLRKLNDIFD